MKFPTGSIKCTTSVGDENRTFSQMGDHHNGVPMKKKLLLSIGNIDWTINHKSNLNYLNLSIIYGDTHEYTCETCVLIDSVNSTGHSKRFETCALIEYAMLVYAKKATFSEYGKLQMPRSTPTMNRNRNPTSRWNLSVTNRIHTTCQK